MHMAIWTICACAAGMKPKDKAKPKMADASLFLMSSVPRPIAEKGAQDRLWITPTEIDRDDGVRIRDSGGGTCRLGKGRPIVRAYEEEIGKFRGSHHLDWQGAGGQLAGTADAHTALYGADADDQCIAWRHQHRRGEGCARLGIGVDFQHDWLSRIERRANRLAVCRGVNRREQREGFTRWVRKFSVQETAGSELLGRPKGQTDRPGRLGGLGRGRVVRS